MSVPKPNSMSDLDNACTVISNNTLYSYSPQAFLSLPLESGAKWNSLDSGVSVTGAVCTGKKLNDPDQASLLVVGGYSHDQGYTGLQEYKFATRKWQTLRPPNPPTRNRRGHGAVYNAASDAIVMFSGGQSDDAAAGPVASGETWKIQISEPWAVTAARPPSSGRAAAIDPMLFSWGVGSDISLISGPADEGTVWLLNSNLQALNSEWRNVGNIKDAWDPASAAVRSTIVHGSDDAMYLVKFDLSQSPITPERIAVPGSGPSPDLAVTDWPQYNSTNAPAVTRNAASITQDHNGLVVISGGNANDPISLFDIKKNSWLEPAQLFGPKVQKNLVGTASSTSQAKSPSTSATFVSSSGKTASSSIESAAATQPNVNGLSPNAILGIALGAIGGILLLALLALFCLKRRKRRMKTVPGGVLNPDEKDTVAFAKSMSPAPYRGHNSQPSTESYSSAAILMGRMGAQKSAAAARVTPGSSRSSTSSLHKQFKSTISKPIPQMSTNPILQNHDERSVAFDASAAVIPRPRNGPVPPDGTRRSSGWNKYWSGGSALHILGYGNKRGTETSERSSRYSDVNSGNNNNRDAMSRTKNIRATQDSATVPPLDFEETRPEFNSVNTGSPVVSQYIDKLPAEAMSGQIERPVSPVSTASGYSSGVPESITSLFDGQGGAPNKPWGTDRAPSSMYPQSQMGPSSVPHGSGVSRQPQLAMAATSSDMSWLNLGGQSRK